MSETMLSLNGKTALVTGGGGGLGSAICYALAEAKADVFLMDMDKPRGKDTETHIKKEGHSACFHKGDVSKAYDIKKAVEEIEGSCGGMDILVNNAARIILKPLEEITEKEWDQMMAVNLKGAFLAVKYCLPLLRRRGGGSIINICSIYGMVGEAGKTAYGTSKGGLISFTRQLAVELAPDGITVNCISPGGVDTETTRHFLRTSRDPEAAEDALLRSIPLNRLATPQEAVGAVVFLASDNSRFITGANLVVDGGLTAT